MNINRCIQRTSRLHVIFKGTLMLQVINTFQQCSERERVKFEDYLPTPESIMLLSLTLYFSIHRTKRAPSKEN